MANWDVLQQAIGISFKDLSLLQQAFVHGSFINENRDFPIPDNERMEFLGDALLNFIAAEELYHNFPKLPEGKLTEIRAELVCRDTLAQIATRLKLNDYLYLGQGEEASGGRQKQTNLANALEALIAAIALDQGLDKAREFALRELDAKLKEVELHGVSRNYKVLLQELAQARQGQTPIYRLIATSGPDHDKEFTVEVLIGDEVVGRGRDKNKQAAEINAAHSAWEKLAAN